MLRRFLAPLALLLALVPTLATRACAQDVKLYGYHTYWMGDRWQAAAPYLDGLFFFDVEINPDGGLGKTNGFPDAWQAFGAASKAQGMFVPTFTMFDSTAFRTVFASAANRARLVGEIDALVTRSGADGAHLDVEMFGPVPAAAREGFSRFTEALRQRLGAKHLSVFLPANDWADAYDEARLARSVDFMSVQGYDLHWMTGPDAGPVAPLRGAGLTWRGIVDRYVALGIPRAKLYLTFPLYGYEWPTETGAPGSKTRGAGRTITYHPVPADLTPDLQVSATARAAQYGARRDAASGSPYYAFQDATGGWNQGWYEDAQSLAEKVAFVRQERLGGLVFFPLGYDDADLVRTVRPPRTASRRR